MKTIKKLKDERDKLWNQTTYLNYLCYYKCQVEIGYSFKGPKITLSFIKSDFEKIGLDFKHFSKMSIEEIRNYIDSLNSRIRDIIREVNAQIGLQK